MFEEFADVLTAEEACEALRIGYNALYELLNSGKLKGFRNGRVWRIPKQSLQTYILESAKIKWGLRGNNEYDKNTTAVTH